MAERAKNRVSGSGAVSGYEKNWLEREVAERGSGVTEIGLSGERKFCRSRSAHMLCSSHHDYAVFAKHAQSDELKRTSGGFNGRPHVQWPTRPQHNGTSEAPEL